jgi:hypothetical protein
LINLPEMCPKEKKATAKGQLDSVARLSEESLTPLNAV